MTPSTTFPVFRKYLNGASFFKVESETEFEEIKISAGKPVLHRFTARIFPDRQLIADMINNNDQHWVAIEESEYDALRSQVQDQ